MAIVIKKQAPMHECTCSHCHSVIGYDDDELGMSSGGKGIGCPECGEFILIEKMSSTKWPDAFYQFGFAEGAVHIGDEQIQKWIDKCVAILKDSPLDYVYTGSGDTLVFAVWDDDMIVVHVAQNYYQATIDFPEESR